MNRFLFFILIPMVLFTTSCSDDEDTIEKPKWDAAMFQGLWFCEDNTTYLEMRYASFTGKIYTDMDSIPSEVESISGRWSFYPTNLLIRMATTYQSSRLIDSRDYKVLGIDDYSMTLLDIQLNAEYTYYKVVASYSMSLGQSIDISLPDYHASSFTPTSSLIADVNNQGHLQAIGSGYTYVKASSETSAVYVKIEVDPRPKNYFMEIKNCTIDDIIEKYGTPQFSGKTDTPNMAIAWDNTFSDTSLEYIHYRYDEETREITQIATWYKNVDSYNSDYLYIKNIFYEIIEETFGEYEWVLNNAYYIIPLYELNGNYHINYNNHKYYNEHGYY